MRADVGLLSLTFHTSLANVRSLMYTLVHRHCLVKLVQHPATHAGADVVACSYLCTGLLPLTACALIDYQRTVSAP
jgi:hypothetical protein